MRRVLVLVLCLLLPLQGFATSQWPEPPCPMQDMVAMANGASGMAEALTSPTDDCCNDLATFERTGQACKSAQSCAAPAAGLPWFPSYDVQTSVRLDPQAPAWRSLPPGTTTRHWRPPTSV